ncbi:MAG: hypothetical protein M1825_000145 [Sarcosagium campestre]|nr:MAG: hypothetical protein M1825_000145 [Sarcosagium campestre]
MAFSKVPMSPKLLGIGGGRLGFRKKIVIFASLLLFTLVTILSQADRLGIDAVNKIRFPLPAKTDLSGAISSGKLSGSSPSSHRFDSADELEDEDGDDESDDDEGNENEDEDTYDVDDEDDEDFDEHEEEIIEDKDWGPWLDFEKNDGLFGGTKEVVNNSASFHFRDEPAKSKSKDGPRVYHPYPDYSSPGWKEQWRGTYSPCVGPRGRLLDESADDQVLAFRGVPKGFPVPQLGSFEAMNLDADVCFDRFSRLAAYGQTEGEDVLPEGFVRPSAVDWKEVNWGKLQKQCLKQNEARFNVEARSTGIHVEIVDESETPHRKRAEGTLSEVDEKNRDRSGHGPEGAPAKDPPKPPRPRNAVLLRTYTGYKYKHNDVRNIRAMISELSLQTGGEYQVFLLVHVRDEKLPFLTDKDVFDRVRRESVPREFWGISYLWSMKTSNKYPLLSEFNEDPSLSNWFGVQRFSQEHPEFDFYWNWEMDSRYTGHYFHLFNSIAEWSDRQPRKGMWERSDRMYIPSAHGAYDTDFRQLVENSTLEDIWGPPKAIDVEPIGPRPPTESSSDDDYSWGVGEAADFISFLPMFNPDGTVWYFREAAWGYHDGERQTPLQRTPETVRRATIVTQSRLSKPLLDTMHNENLVGHHMGAEMWPHSIALTHGLKAVYAPHPIWLDRKWPTSYLASRFNPGPHGESGTVVESPFSILNEGPWWGTSWYYRSELPRTLYWTWLGWKEKIAHPVGGFTHSAFREELTDFPYGGPDWESKHGRLCLPGMLFHPIKDVAP